MNVLLYIGMLIIDVLLVGSVCYLIIKLKKLTNLTVHSLAIIKTNDAIRSGDETVIDYNKVISDIEDLLKK